MERVDGKIIHDTGKAITISVGIMIVAIILDAFILLDAWLGLIIIFLAAAFGPFVLDLVISWFGCSIKIRALLLVAYAIVLPIGTFLFLLGLGVNLDSSSSYAAMMFFLAGFAAFFAAFSFTSQKILRMFKGIRTSGELKKGVIGLAIPAEVVQGYSNKTIENQIESVIISGIKCIGYFTFERSKKSSDGFNIAKADNFNVLYRVKGYMVEILCIPIFGIVARFEKASESVENVIFPLKEILSFYEIPTDEMKKEMMDDIQNGYDNLRNPSSKRIATKIAKLALVAVPATILIIIAAFIAQNWNALSDSLADQRTTNILVSIASIVAILVAIIAIMRYILKWNAEKKND